MGEQALARVQQIDARQVRGWIRTLEVGFLRLTNKIKKENRWIGLLECQRRQGGVSTTLLLRGRWTLALAGIQSMCFPYIKYPEASASNKVEKINKFSCGTEQNGVLM